MVPVARLLRGIAAERHQVNFEPVAIVTVDDAVDRLHPVGAVEERRDVADAQLAGRRRARRTVDRPDLGAEAPAEGAARAKHAGIPRRRAARNHDGYVLLGTRSQPRVCRRPAIGFDRRSDVAQFEKRLGQQVPRHPVVRPQAHGIGQGVVGLAEGASPQPCRPEAPPCRVMVMVGGDQAPVDCGRRLHLARHEQGIGRFDGGHRSPANGPCERTDPGQRRPLGHRAPRIGRDGRLFQIGPAPPARSGLSHMAK